MAIDAASLARNVYEAFNDRDWDRALEYAAPDMEATVVPLGITASGRDGFLGFMQGWVEMSSDLKVEVTHQHLGDGVVVNEITARGTHDGPFVTPTGEIGATGRALDIPAVEVWEVADGKIRRLRNYVDASTLWLQVVDPVGTEERVREFYEEVVNKGNLDRIPDFVTEDWVDHEAVGSSLGISPDREGIAQFLTMFREPFPDLKFTVDEVLIAGDLVTVRARISGTHRGEFIGAPATGKHFEIQTIDILRMEGDRAAEHWGVTDMLAMMQQLGLAEEATVA